MATTVSLSGNTNLRGEAYLEWYKESSLALNGVFPSLIHQYDKGRYYNTVDKQTAFPFTTVRTSNATQFDSQGRLVWAPANMIVRSGVTGATVGVIGSGGATPTGWTAITTTGITREIVAVGSNYIDIRWFGTNASGSTVFPHLYLDALTTAVNGAKYTLAANISVVGGSTSGWDSLNGRIELQYFLTGAYIAQATATTSPTATDTRYSVNATFPATGVANQWRPAIRMGVLGSATVDLTLRIHSPQLEYTGVDSPKSYNPTNGTAYYGPRFDYNPSTLTARGVLVEGQITNVLTFSRDVSQSVWTKTALTAGQTLTGISNIENEAQLITEDGTATALLHAGGAVAAGATVTVSAVLKRTGGGACDWVRIICSDSSITNGVDAWFNLNTGTVGTLTLRGIGSAATSSIQNLGNGWYRCIVSCIPDAVYTAARIAISSALGDNNGGRVANATYGFDHAQIEVAASASSLIPTFGAAATRIQDSLSMSFSGYNASGGVLYAKYDLPEMSTTSFPSICLLSDGTSSNRLHISNVISSATTAQGIMHSVSGGVNDVNTGLPPSVSTLDMKTAFRYKRNDYYGTTNGGAGAVDVTCTPPVGVNALAVGQASPGAVTLSRWVKEIRYYPDTTASNAQLQALTS